MRILLISPVFPPFPDSESFCGGKFAQGLLAAGVQLQVIHCSNTRPSKEPDSSALWASLAEVSVDVPNRREMPRLLRGWLGLRYQTTSWIAWTRDAVLQARALHRAKPFDLLISRALPWHAHLAGYWVAAALRIPWVANFNDPWDLRPFIADRSRAETWKVGLNVNRWMRKTLARADLVTFPCERLRDRCLEGLSRRPRVAVIPHVGAVSETLPNSGDDFVLVHAGKLGMNELTARPANALLEGLAELFRTRPNAREKTRLILVGPEDRQTLAQAARLGLGDAVVSTGWVNFERSLEFIASASACLLVEGDFPEGIFLPSKLGHYLAARKPVLALSPAVGTVNDLAKERGVVRMDPKNPRQVSEVLARFFNAYCAGELSLEAPADSLVRQFESKRVIGTFLESIRDLVLAGQWGGLEPVLQG
jgi:hypothetical protein